MTGNKFRFKLDKRAKILTVLALLVIGAGVTFLFYESGGTYLPAWFTTLVVALMLLAFLSIPRFVMISPHSIEIHCTVELVQIPIRNIKNIKFIERREMRFCFPLWGIYGIFGYFGYFLNLRQGRVLRMYASKWKNFVLIEDIYEEQYMISCEDPQKFVEQVEKYR